MFRLKSGRHREKEKQRLPLPNETFTWEVDSLNSKYQGRQNQG